MLKIRRERAITDLTMKKIKYKDKVIVSENIIENQ